MKKILFGLLFVSFFISVFADKGWRTNEKEVKVYLKNTSDFEKLYTLKLNGDVGIDHAIVYVIPSELELLQRSGLKYEILKDDLNLYYKDFWQNREAYHTYEEIIELADSLATNFPEICEKYIYGSSVQGRQLAALKISDNVGIDEPEPEIMFDGGIHGDEIGASENVIRFARHLCLSYNTDVTITELINTREIWLFLMVNPDGRVSLSRYNANGVDLNRDWGYMWDGWGNSTGAYSQIESKALRDCMYNNQFVVHTNFHSGTEFISCPWSYRPQQCPDFDHIIQLAGVYSTTSGYPNLTYGQGCTGLYPINGCTKDSYYGIMGSVSWAMEISHDKQPPVSQLLYYYSINVPAMLAMIEYSGFGVKGIVTDANTGDPVAAAIFVNNYFPTYSDATAGDFHKYVLPGTYSITVVANGYQTKTISNIVVTNNSSTTTDFELTPEDGQYIYKISSSRIPDNNQDDEGNTPGIIGAPDNVNYSIGKNGWVVCDMQFPIPDAPGNDIVVYEGDMTPEGYICYAGETIDGPWIQIGTGEGTTEFDLINGGVSEARFFKIKDGGDGSASGDNAGFDLDAIAALEQIPGVYIALLEYYVDDASGNGNGKIDPGETVDIIVTLRNNGDQIAEGVTGEIEANSAEFTIITQTADFGDLGQYETAQGIYTVTASESIPIGEMVEIILNVSANSGSYTNSFTMDFCVGHIPVLIVDFDENSSSAPIIQNQITAFGVTSDMASVIPADVNLYASVFVCLGIYSNNYVLSSSEGQALADYLNAGGKLYMEGGDTWYFDSQTAVHPMFNIDPEADGTSDLVTIDGIPGSFTEGMCFNYSGENHWIDHINPIAPAFLILENQSPNYGCGVAYDAGDYKTIGTSFEFGGLDDSETTKYELMEQYLDFFGILPSGGITQSFELNTGYQFISSRVEVENPDMLVVLEDILNENLVFVRNSNAQMLRKIGPNWVNGIGDWIVEEGYLFKMNAADSFTIEGDAVDPTTPIPVAAGFQFVSYFPENSMDALIAFETIIGDDLDFIRNSLGQTIRKIGPNWVNGIGDCYSGEGYLVKMSGNGEIVYPETAN